MLAYFDQRARFCVHKQKNIQTHQSLHPLCALCAHGVTSPEGLIVFTNSNTALVRGIQILFPIARGMLTVHNRGQGAHFPGGIFTLCPAAAFSVFSETKRFL